MLSPIKKTIFFLFLFFLFIFFSAVIQASEFSTAYEVVYEIKDSGETIVTNEISLTNLKSDLYAKEYRLSIGTENISSIKVSDSKGQLNPEITKKDGKTMIKVAFNDKVVGKGKTLKFVLSYLNPEIAFKRGQIWEVKIPKPEIDKTVSSYKIVLVPPLSFGEPTYLKPKPSSDLIWVFDQQFSSSITVVFGKHQNYDFNLDYYLENKGLTTRTYQIPIPPDTLYQKVILDKITPHPQNIVLDNDGNWLAEYQLFPKTSVQITVTGTAYLFLEARPDFPIKELLNREEYLNSDKYWEVNDPEIQKIAQELKTPAKIYQYVVRNLAYDRSKIGKAGQRLGAKNAVLNPQDATCAEFTDLFIALCRAAGIPAREINGFAYSDDPLLKPVALARDLLHAWPEYYDDEKKIWIPVDPTWENTAGGVDYFHSFDLNHFAFVIHGLSSQTPAPPGAYTLSEDKGVAKKNVNVAFSDRKDSVTSFSKPDLELFFPKKVIAGKKILGQAKIINTGNQALTNLSLKATSSNYELETNNWRFLIIPPFGHRTLALTAQSKNFLFWGENFFHFKINGVEKKIAVNIIPLPVLLFPYFLGTALSFLALALIKWFKKRVWR